MKAKAVAAAALPGLVGALAFAEAIRASDFIRDDRLIVAENPLLQSAAGLLRLWTTGYWEAVAGSGASVAEYRPFTMLTFYADLALFGRSPGALHAGNVLLHALNCLLLAAVLRRFMADRAAWCAALAFAVMPIHAEAVCGLVGRSELLAALWMLSAWTLLGAENNGRGRVLGTAAYALGLLSKESVILFPFLVLLSDWARGRGSESLPNQLKRRRNVYLPLALATASYLAVRAAVLAHPFQGGRAYFSGASLLVRWLTIARFWIERYLWPSLTGAGLCNDFSRPLVPDSSPADALAWACLAGLAAVGAAACWKLAVRRRRWAFWILVPILFLLPTSNIFIPLDTLGAQRFLYFPSISLAAGAGWAVDRLLAGRRRFAFAAAAGVLAFWTLSTVRRSRAWASDTAYYSDAIACNPVSAGARVGRAMAAFKRGDRAGAERSFQEAIRLDPSLWSPYYDLGKLAFEAGAPGRAEPLFLAALERNPKSSSTMVFLGLAAEARSGLAEAEAWYRRALAVQDLDGPALENLGLLLWKTGRRPEGARYLARFLTFFPGDDDSPMIRAMLWRERPSLPR